MFPYGTAYDPTDNTILVGDYWNYRIQRYSNTGQHIATYRNSVGAGVGAPYGVTVDPNDTSACGERQPRHQLRRLLGRRPGTGRRRRVRPHRPRRPHDRSPTAPARALTPRAAAAAI